MVEFCGGGAGEEEGAEEEEEDAPRVQGVDCGCEGCESDAGGGEGGVGVGAVDEGEG